MPTRHGRASGRAALLAAVGVATAVAGLVVGARVIITEQAPITLARAEGPIQLSANPIWVPLRDPATGTALTVDKLRERVARGRVMLVLEDLSADAPPASVFAVHVGAARGSEASKADADYVDRFSFYNEINAGALKATPSSRSYDVTGVIQRLLASGDGASPVGVTIRPERQPRANAHATVGAIELVAP